MCRTVCRPRWPAHSHTHTDTTTEEKVQSNNFSCCCVLLLFSFFSCVCVCVVMLLSHFPSTPPPPLLLLLLVPKCSLFSSSIPMLRISSIEFARQQQQQLMQYRISISTEPTEVSAEEIDGKFELCSPPHIHIYLLTDWHICSGQCRWGRHANALTPVHSPSAGKAFWCLFIIPFPFLVAGSHKPKACTVKSSPAPAPAP